MGQVLELLFHHHLHRYLLVDQVGHVFHAYLSFQRHQLFLCLPKEEMKQN